MNTKRWILQLQKRLIYTVAALLLLLQTTRTVAKGNAYADDSKSKQQAAAGKKETDPRMFLIAVIDSRDDSIGERCKTDLAEITEAFGDYADEVGADLIEPKIIKGDQFGKAAVNDAIDNWLKSQQPSKTDMVVFYYSGHGFRYPNDASNYPRMWLKHGTDKDIATNNLQIKEDIYDRIVKMGAGFNLIISDCCNNTVAGDNANFDNVMVTTRKRETRKRDSSNDQDGPDDVDNSDKLFMLGHPLSVLVTAAGKGELAAGTADAGGFFTNYLLEALDKCIFDEDLQPTWDVILKYADEKAGYWARSAACPTAKHNEQGRCVQEAEIKIDGAN